MKMSQMMDVFSRYSERLLESNEQSKLSSKKSCKYICWSKQPQCWWMQTHYLWLLFDMVSITRALVLLFSAPNLIRPVKAQKMVLCSEYNHPFLNSAIESAKEILNEVLVTRTTDALHTDTATPDLRSIEHKDIGLLSLTNRSSMTGKQTNHHVHPKFSSQFLFHTPQTPSSASPTT